MICHELITIFQNIMKNRKLLVKKKLTFANNNEHSYFEYIAYS